MINTLNDKPSFRLLGQELAEALKAIGDKHGVTIAYSGGTLGIREATMKLRLRLKPQPGAKSPEAETFEKFAEHFGLKKEDLGETFACRQKLYRIVGLDITTRGGKVITEQVGSGKTNNWKLNDVLELLGRRSFSLLDAPTVG